MKFCEKCGQLVAEEIVTCPSCGSEIAEGRKFIDDYRILEVLHEGYASILCRAARDDTDEPVMIRIFTPQSGVDEKIAERLKRELQELKKLPEDYFVRHLEIQKSTDGLWYRVSEWVNAENWGTLLASGTLRDYQTALTLFSRIAGHFIPHLILNDIMVFRDDQSELKVKIDYKLSRFFDPKLDRPSPMLKKLLLTHPDILNQRPLDFRSDIWSLGKIFIEVLSADHETKDYQEKIKELALPHDIDVLFKIMLSDDPDLRPQSMAEVAETLNRVKGEEIEAASRLRLASKKAPWLEIIGIKKRISLLALVLTVLIVFGGLTWFYSVFKKKDSEAILVDYANRYAGSVAFVMADYWLKSEETFVYRNRTEGTAFLVDEKGYLLTNRHVASPWLEDEKMFLIINQFRQFHRPLRFGHRLFLWFEGERAFKRLPGLSQSSDLEDIYFIDSAYSTEKPPRLAIAGVAKPPVKAWQLVKSPLRDDFAVLKIENVPKGLKPLPLDHKMEPLRVQKLSPIITLGFPLGSRTQETEVNVSVTRGNVRRIFNSLLQVDTSIYRGNSGGPIIDLRGKVIGIASRVAMDAAIGPVPVATLLSDIGMVLPITKAAAFLTDLKNGKIKWDGILDLSIGAKLGKITSLARESRWTEARELANRELETSLNPALVIAGGMLHFCVRDYEGARHLFSRALSMDTTNDNARLMVYIIDWLAGNSLSSPFREELTALDWRSSFEFFAHLVRVLEGEVPETNALEGGYTQGEKSWLHYLVGLRRVERRDLKGSEEVLKTAVLAADNDSWLYYLALAKLEHIQNQRLAALKNPAEQKRYRTRTETFSRRIKDDLKAGTKNQLKLAPLLAGYKQASNSPGDKRAFLEKIFEIDPTDKDVLYDLAYYASIEGAWETSLEYIRLYLKTKGRENLGRLSLGLLESEILNFLGEKEEAKNRLQKYVRTIKDPWFLNISRCLLGEYPEKSLAEKAGENLEYLITGHTALGFWSEGAGNPKKALNYYREALGTYLDDWRQFEFAWERMRQIRNK
jgi:S1-C subfamily serine protease